MVCVSVWVLECVLGSVPCTWQSGCCMNVHDSIQRGHHFMLSEACFLHPLMLNSGLQQRWPRDENAQGHVPPSPVASPHAPQPSPSVPHGQSCRAPEHCLLSERADPPWLPARSLPAWPASCSGRRGCVPSQQCCPKETCKIPTHVLYFDLLFNLLLFIVAFRVSILLNEH